MKTNFRFLALSAAILSMFTACQREELEQNQKPEALTHSVTFVAGAPETKTIATIEGNTVNYAWTAEDVDRFTVYENGIAATTVTAELGTDGTMSMTATFSGDVPASPKYQALYNSEVSANQNIVKNSYAEESDVMVSNVLDGTRNDNFIFSFKREVAFAKMTLKCLTSGAYVSSVTIESDKPIAGGYDLETGTFVNTSNVITLDVLTDVANGNATVWFTTIPVEDATFTITAETINEDMTVAATYTKTFSKTITLTRGDVKGFGVEMVKNTPKTYGYQKISEVSDYTPGDYIIVAHVYKDNCPTKGDFAIANELSLSSQKLLGKEVTNLIDNDVISVSDGASYKLSLSGDKDNIVISNGTNILAYDSSTDLVLNGDNKYWTLSLNEGNGGTFLLLNNSTATASTKRALSFQSYSTSGSTKTASLKFGAYAASNINNVDYAAIELYKYQEVTPSTPKYSVTFAEITGGTLSATPSKAEAGAEVTLIATPDAGYVFNNDWTVTAADNSSIEVAEGKFIMPAQDVTVSASFSMAEVTATYPYAESFDESQGKFTISDVTLPVELTYVWQHSSYNNEGYMKASAYKNKTNYAAESWLISPVIDMSAAVNPVLSFMTVARYGSNENLTLWAREKGGDWAQLSFSNYGTGNDWNFVSNTVDLSAYAGKTLQFAYKYVSTDTGASTWEIKNVEVKEQGAAATLSSIAWTGYTTTYTVGDVFKADGTVTATYSDGSTKDVTSEASFSTPDMSTAGAKTVTITYEGETTTGEITVKDSGSTGGETKYFVKVTSAPADWSGEYLIVYEEGNVAFDGSLTTLDAASNTVLVTISNSKIKATDELLKSTFTINAAGTTIQSKSGYYIGQTTNGNGLKSSSSTSYTNTLSFTDSGDFTAVSSSAYLRYNSASNQTRFRYYKSGSYTGQKAIQLYKLEN